MTRGDCGFSLVELLVALAICAVVAAGIAAVVPPARAAFEVTPAVIDLQQRGRTAIDVIVQAIRAAGRDAEAAADLGPLSGIVPAVIPLGPAADGKFTRLKVIAPRSNAGQSVLAHHQAGHSGPLALAFERCPAVTACGFTRDTTALIADGSGRFDVFTVASIDSTANTLLTNRSFTWPYAAGSVVVEVDVDTFQLEAQPDGSHTLVRLTAAGAHQPIVDRISALSFEPFIADISGALVPAPFAMLTDGPWHQGNPGGGYDDDVFLVRRMDIGLTLHAALPSTTTRAFHFAVSLRNAP